MSYLNGHGDGGKRANKVQHAAVQFFLLVIPQTKVTLRDSALRFHGGGFDYKQACARNGQIPVVHMVPLRRTSFICGVLVHGRNNDTVGEHEPAESDGREKGIHANSCLTATGP